jgi:uncharacterized protein (TIGR01244 family)
VKNTQDIATLAPGLVNAFCPIDGIATGGQPRAEDVPRFAAAGYRSIVDLRPPSESRGFDEESAARAAGLRYENIPVTPQTLRDADFDRFRAFVADRANRPMLVHCASANRVGALLLPYLLLDERLAPDAALSLARQIGLRSRELTDAALRYARDRGATA